MNCYVDIETTGFSPKNDAFTRLTARDQYIATVADSIQIIRQHCELPTVNQGCEQ